MGNIAEKTLTDLEFYTVLHSIEKYCLTDLGKKKVQEIRPISRKEILLSELSQTFEYVSSFENDNRIPTHYFDEITKEIHLLTVENSYLEPTSFLKIASLTNTVLELLKFFKKFEVLYPTLTQNSVNLTYDPSIAVEIQKIISPFGTVSDTASPNLKQIRKLIAEVRSQITDGFNKALSKFNGLGYLDDIRESVMENHRVLAVLAAHKKKVKGLFLGTSKSGSIAFIAPEVSLHYTRELQDLAHQEKEEIIKILKKLTDELRPFHHLLIEYQNYLVHLDIVSAKAKYAVSIKATLPEIIDEKRLLLKNAYHPILVELNNQKKIKTIPQSFELNEKHQIIVISGPNAGGKSITLKTVGILQLMIQSGILVPVHERSEMFLFDTILTDIGDNQSIENHLSTYSYRLKNMRQFLKKCQENTLFLIDEFGTGSDPELGGALAEVFLEEFYHRKAFGIITTHYANLKILADELPNVVNANMQFDEKTLEPLYHLHIGQPGSSFTFEVAQKNGIPFSIINRAKKRVEKGKVRLDKTISKLQKERNKLQKTSEILEIEKDKVIESSENLQETQDKMQQKLTQFYELYDQNQKMLIYGRKINELANKYFQSNNKKQFLAEFNLWIASEKEKYQKKNPPKPIVKTASKKIIKKADLEVLKKQEALIATEKEVLKEVEKIKVVVEETKKVELEKKKNYQFKLHDQVRLFDGNACGTIDKIEKNIATVNYGIFTTKVSIEQLELVQRAKK
ncbi:MAG: DNA mismatch repair protein MutS [Flavobacteriaceae bacterium]|nr:DNA mismatch repair protein MutS [Flavobacteriaceae bacterium]